MHRPSCCAAGRDDKVVPSALTVKNEPCKFPFTYDGHRYDSCTIIGTHKARHVS